MAAAALALGASACGDAGSAGGLDDTLGYFPADAALVAVVSTDLDDEQFEVLEERLTRPVFGQSIETLLRAGADRAGLSYEDDVEPLLGRELVVGLQGIELGGDEDPELTVVFQATDGGRLREALRKTGAQQVGEDGETTLFAYPAAEISLAVDGDVLVAAANEEIVRRALDRKAAGDGLDEETFSAALTGLSDDALVRVYANPSAFGGRQDVERLRQLPWVAALESAGAAVTFAEEELRVDAVANTDAGSLSDDDLPLAAGSDSPELVPSATEISGGNLNQSVTTVFLLRAARLVAPDSRFVQDVDALEQELGIDFAEEILRQFDGPSVSLLSPDGRHFAARSVVRDPEALRAHLEELGPVLPELIQDLNGLTSQGLALLLLFAPDAPALPAAFTQVQVQEPTSPEGLYHVTGLTGDGPAELWFGLDGEYFVVASDEQRAHAIADLETEAVEGARGVGVTHVGAEAVREVLSARFGSERVSFGDLVASLEASTEELRARVRLSWD
jgi:hypothetical protein